MLAMIVNIVFTYRNDRIRIIALRKANHHEREIYSQFLN